MVRLSHTSANLYTECGYKYKLRYIDKIKPEDLGSALFFGKALDKAIESVIKRDKDPYQVFKDNMTTVDIDGQSFNFRDLKNIKYSKIDKDVMHLTDDQIESYRDNIAWGALYEKGLLMLKCFIDNIYPKIKKVYSLQEEINFTNEDGDSIIGYCDMVAEIEGYEGPIIIDFKTSSIQYKAKSAEKSEQLALYYKYMSQKYKTDKVGFIVLYKKLKRINRKTTEHEVKYDIIIDTVDPEFVETNLDRYQKILENIENGVFEQNLKSCKQYWGKCDYYHICHPFGE